MKKIKKFSVYFVFALLNIAFGIVQPFLSLLISTDIINEYSENVFMAAILGALLIYSYLYTYVKELIKYFFSRISKISPVMDKICIFLYVAVSGILLFLICRYRNLGTTGDALTIICIIFNVALVLMKYYIRSGFFDYLTYQKENIKNEYKKKEILKHFRSNSFRCSFWNIRSQYTVACKIYILL